jgi:hypothetical protein
MVTRTRDGSTWRVGTDAEVAWIAEGISVGRTITAAIPPVFGAYATVLVEWEEEERVKHDRAVLALLAEQSPDQVWWLGFLDTGVDDIIFPDAPQVTLYPAWSPGWHYVLIEAGPEQAAAWHPANGRAYGTGDLPNLIFPADHSWLVSTLWDDDWSCIGGPSGLVEGLLRHPDLRARRVALGEDATPPGYEAQ